MSQKNIMVFAAFGSFMLLALAFLFQALGWAPCKLCLWQRWPHVVAIFAGVMVALFGPSRSIGVLGALGTAGTAGIAAYHSGVELKWWPGPASCSGAGNGLSGLSAAELLPGASDIPELVMCDTLAPFFLGLTMANWNLIASASLAGLWLAAAFKPAS